MSKHNTQLRKTGKKKNTAVKKPVPCMPTAGTGKAARTAKPEVQTTKNIAFISGRIGSAFVSGVVRGTEERVRSFGGNAYRLEHYPSAGRKNGAGDAVREILEGGKTDGIIVLSVLPDEAAVEQLLKSCVPAVFIERQVAGAHSVTIDNYAGGYAAGLQFVNNGRSRPGIILDPQCSDAGSAAFERVRGFKDALKKSGIKLDRRNSAKVDFHNIEQGRQAFEQVAKQVKKMDSIFSAAGDLAAIGFMIEARAGGVQVPGDLSIIGFDDVEMASAVEPPLTTVRQPIHRMGAAAMEIIHEHFKSGLKSHKNIVLESELIVRETT